jgi:hypothetical protein
MVSSMIPTGGEKNVGQLIDKTGGFNHILKEGDKLSKVDVDKVTRIDFSGDAVFNVYVFLLLLIGFEYFVPNVEEITIIGIDIQWIAGVVYPMVRGRQDQFVEKSHSTVFHQVFSGMYKRSVGTIHEHDNKQKCRVDPQKNTNGSSDDIGIGSFQKEVGMRYT